MRRAAIEIQADILSDAIPALRDAGIKIVETLRHPFPPGGILLFIVESFDLPPECDGGRLVVSPIFTKETYGEQQVIKLSEMRVVGPYVSEEEFRSRENLKNRGAEASIPKPPMLLQTGGCWSSEQVEKFRKAWEDSAKRQAPLILGGDVSVFELRDGKYVRLGEYADEAAS